MMYPNPGYVTREKNLALADWTRKLKHNSNNNHTIYIIIMAHFDCSSNSIGLSISRDESDSSSPSRRYSAAEEANGMI